MTPAASSSTALSATIDGVARTIASPESWREARSAMEEKEKAHMRAGDQLAAERRTMPWMKMDPGAQFIGPQGPTNLLGLFAGRKQLIVYHFMFGPTVPGWPSAGCVGCSMLLDQIGHLSHLRARDIEFALVSPAPHDLVEAYRIRMGWDVPWYSSCESFNRLCDVADELDNSHGLNVFYRDGADVYRTHFVRRRGVEALGTVWSLLDITPFGRQEQWETSPAGTPQGPRYEWWRRHDEYQENCGPRCCCTAKS